MRESGIWTEMSFRLWVRAPRMRTTGAGRGCDFIEPVNLPENAPVLFRRPVPFIFRKLLRRRRGIRLGLPEEPLVLRTERGRSGARDEHFGHAPRTTGRHEEPGVRVDVGGHDVRRHGKTFREELWRKRSRILVEDRNSRLGAGQAQLPVVVVAD